MKKFYLMIFTIVTLAGMLVISGCNRPETYTVTFNPNGGTGTMAAQTFTEGEAQTLMSNTFTYEGYTFTGWNTVQDGSSTSYTDGQTITATADMTLYAQWKVVPQIYEYVDLGLPSGTLWATCNVGANAPEEYGDYFAWGETVPKETYAWSTYKYCNGEYNTITKYSNNAEYGNNSFTDTLTILEACDDAATANWGVGWRMPTWEEMNELYDICTHEWTTQNGVNGGLFTGPNGNSIFLPAAGRDGDSDFAFVGSAGFYWNSKLGWLYPLYACYFAVGSSGDFGYASQERFYGFSVRPVCQSQN